jgi:hypothetical protein
MGTAYCNSAITPLPSYCLYLCTVSNIFALEMTRRLYTAQGVAYANVDFGTPSYTYTCTGPADFKCYCPDLRNLCLGGGTVGNDNIGSAKCTPSSTMYLYADFNFGSYMGPVPRGLSVNFNGGNWRNNIASSLILEVTV